MNTNQTRPAPPLNPALILSPRAQSLLADLDNPDLTELDFCRRHGLTLDQLRAETRRPAFRHAVAIIDELRDLRRPLILARAEADAARTLTALTARDPASATAAKEIRLAVKDLLKLLGAAGFQPVDRAQPDALGGAGFQPASPGAPSPAPAGEVARRSRDGGGLRGTDRSRHAPEPPPPPLRSGTAPGSPGEAAPAPTPRKPPRKGKYPRGTKPRPKPVSR